MRLEGKRIVVTGGASGIGRATAVQCASDGALVVVADLDGDGAGKVAERIEASGGRAWPLGVDVSDDEQVAGLMRAAQERMSGIDGLVTAAGVGTDPLTPIEEFEVEDWDRVIGINLTGTFLCAKHAVSAMKQSGGGVIVMIASGAGVTEPASMLGYGASKGGVNGLGMTLEAKLADSGIRVNVVCPGQIDTPMMLDNLESLAQKSEAEAERSARRSQDLGTPEGLAKVLAFLLSNDAGYVRGTLFTR